MDIEKESQMIQKMYWHLQNSIKNAALANDALERNAQSFIERTIAASIDVGTEHLGCVSVKDRTSVL